MLNLKCESDAAYIIVLTDLTSFKLFKKNEWLSKVKTHLKISLGFSSNKFYIVI